MAAIRTLRNSKKQLSTISKRFISVQLNVNRNEESIVKENWKRRCELATAYRAIEKFGMCEALCNHLTAKAPSLKQEDDVILIIPYGLLWSEVTPECFAGINLETAEVVEGVDPPDCTAHSIHRAIYRYRPDVKSIMHTHSKYSTSLSLLEDPELKMYHQNCTRFYEKVQYDLDFGGISLDGENSESERIGQKMQDKSKQVLLMGNHGVTVVGESISLAFDRLFYFERACRSLIIAYQTGRKIRDMEKNAILSAQDVIVLNEEQYAQKHLEAMQRILKKEDPTFIMN